MDYSYFISIDIISIDERYPLICKNHNPSIANILSVNNLSVDLSILHQLVSDKYSKEILNSMVAFS